MLKFLYGGVNVVIERSAVRKENSVSREFILPFFAVLAFFIVLLFIIKSLPADDFSKDMHIADFRFDVNKLMEASALIELKRKHGSRPELYEFGATGKFMEAGDINQNLRRVLVKTANLDDEQAENAVTALGIMSLKEDLYAEELKSFQYDSLTCDNNLKHYVVITKGEFAGTILYNGNLQFIDSKKRCYFGVELFEQL